MKNTKANVIKLLQQMKANSYRCADVVKDEELAIGLRTEARAYDLAISILESNKDFNDIYKIFN